MQFKIETMGTSAVSITWEWEDKDLKALHSEFREEIKLTVENAAEGIVRLAREMAQNPDPAIIAILIPFLKEYSERIKDILQFARKFQQDVERERMANLN